MAALSAPGRSGRTSATQGGGAVTTLAITATALSPSCGGRPVTAKNATAPSE